VQLKIIDTFFGIIGVARNWSW